jgi:hypothetical protein
MRRILLALVMLPAMLLAALTISGRTGQGNDHLAHQSVWSVQVKLYEKRVDGKTRVLVDESLTVIEGKAAKFISGGSDTQVEPNLDFGLNMECLVGGMEDNQVPVSLDISISELAERDNAKIVVGKLVNLRSTLAPGKQESFEVDTKTWCDVIVEDASQPK